MTIFYHNDRYVDAVQARVSADDRGFRFGDGLFETIAVYGGKPYQIDWHMERLQAGLAALKIPQTLNLKPETLETIKRNNITEGFARIMISRGEGSIGYLPKPNIKPTILIEAFPRTEPLPQPATLFRSSHIKPPLESLPTNMKLAQGVNSTLARLEAQENGCFEALQVNAQGHLCEASSANLFWVKKGIVYTPSLSTGCLNGSTRAALMRITKVHQVKDPPTALHEADEVFLTNCVWRVLPVIELKPLGYKWSPGKITADLHELLKRDIAR